jgi:hypothetical protein
MVWIGPVEKGRHVKEEWIDPRHPVKGLEHPKINQVTLTVG